ncbi:MAG: YhgE/Pip family protein [Bacilli bacterium]|nr:YhgE/Pip family protein [Bacilli bacterium]
MALNEESPLLRANSSQINDGINKISSSLGLLTNASEALSQASAQLKQGSLQLSSGSAKLMQGSQQLNEALTNLKTGSDTLVTKVNDGLKAINTINLNDNVAKQMSNPSQLVHQKYSDVPNYGHALAPYVLSLSLFVGCLIFNFIMPVRRKATQDAKVKQWWLSKIILGLIGALSMALILASVMLLLGLEPDHLGRYYLMAIITAMCYMSVIMFLAISFDNPGRFLAMVLLVLQLSGSGGTFPMPLTGSFFNTIHPLLPMTYSIYGFREAISSGLGINTFTNAIMVLIIIIVVAYLLLYFSMKVLDKRMEHLKNKFKPQKSND